MDLRDQCYVGLVILPLRAEKDGVDVRALDYDPAVEGDAIVAVALTAILGLTRPRAQSYALVLAGNDLPVHVASFFSSLNSKNGQGVRQLAEGQLPR